VDVKTDHHKIKLHLHKSTNMQPQLQKLFDKIEKQKQDLLLLIQSHNPAQLQHSSLGQWSLGQVYAHLITSERMSMQYLKKKYLGIQEQPRTGIIEELKIVALVISQRLPFKFKAPKVVQDNTPLLTDAGTIAEAWAATRLEMNELLNQFTADQLTRKVYKHPVAGRLNIQQAVRFFSEHMIHHTPQIKRLLKQS
jgi:uncharacterized damage-inducible protein DinB